MSKYPNNPRLPFLANLNLPDLSRLMNYPMSHDPVWMIVPTKLPLNIPKFEGKAGEDPGEHVTTFHASKLTTRVWKMPKLANFMESLTQEQDKLVMMGTIKPSKDQALVAASFNPIPSFS